MNRTVLLFPIIVFGSNYPVFGAQPKNIEVRGVKRQNTHEQTTTHPRIVDATDFVENLHGIELRDPYRWMENATDPKVIKWKNEQDISMRRMVGKLPGRDKIAVRMKELLTVTTQSLPINRSGRSFYNRTGKGDDVPIYYWKENATGKETEFLGPRTIESYNQYSISDYEPCWNGKLLAYMIHHHGSDVGTVRVRDVDNGKDIPSDTIQNILKGIPKWSPNCEGFYYIADPGGVDMPRAKRLPLLDVRFHQIGTPSSSDRIIMKATGLKDTILSLSQSEDSRFLFINIRYAWTRNELFVIDLRSANQKIIPLRKENKSRAKVTGIGDTLVMLTEENAPRGRIVAARYSNQSEQIDWSEIISESKKGVFEEIELVGRNLITHTIEDAVSVIEVRSISGKLMSVVELPTKGTVRGIRSAGDGDSFFFLFESFAFPRELYRYFISIKYSAADK